MIARKVKPGVLKIINQPFDQNRIESYTLLNIDDRDALLLLYASSMPIKEDNQTFIITYGDGDLVDKMFKAIANKHSKSNPDFMDVSIRYELDMDAIPGTSVLIRDPEKQTIKIAYRKTSNFSKACNINRLFVDNAMRESFFKDAVNGMQYKRYGKFVLGHDDGTMYDKWSSYMNDRYFEIVGQLKSNKVRNND